MNLNFDFASAGQRLADRVEAAGWEPLVSGLVRVVQVLIHLHTTRVLSFFLALISTFNPCRLVIAIFNRWAAGALLYPATLAAVQHTILKPLRVGAHSRVVGTVFGLGSIVCAASVASEGFIGAGRATSAGLKAHRNGADAPDAIQEGLHHALVVRRPRSAVDVAASSRHHREHGSSPSISLARSILAAIAALGQDGTLEHVSVAAIDMANAVLHSDRTAAAFIYGSTAAIWVLLCGARLRAVCPSNLMSPGAFARVSIPARRFIHATPKEKGLNNTAGDRFGCHSCGRKEAKGRYVADHQPPSKLVSPLIPIIIYIKCVRARACACVRAYACVHACVRALQRLLFFLGLNVNNAAKCTTNLCTTTIRVLFTCMYSTTVMVMSHSDES